jgi:hypothetical protein
MMKEAQLWKSYLNVFKNKPVDFFAIKYFFPHARDGFDIVIGNPPYVKKEHLSEEQIKNLEDNFTEETSSGKKPWSDDLYVHFIFRGFEFTKEHGNLNYITNDSFVGFKTKKRVRDLLLSKNLKQLIQCPEETFDATIYTAIFLAKNEKSNGEFIASSFYYPSYTLEEFSKVAEDYVKILPNNSFTYKENPIVDKLLSCDKFEDTFNFKDTGIHSGNVRKKLFFKDKPDESAKRLLQGRQIGRWAIWWDNPKAKYKFCNPDYEVKPVPGIGRGGKPSKKDEYWNFCGEISNHHKPERLLIRQTADEIIAAFQSEKEDGQFYTDNTLFTVLPSEQGANLKYALCLLNSSTINYYYRRVSMEEGKVLAQVKTGILNKLPYKSVEDKKEFIELANKIIKIKRKNPEVDVSGIKEQIDELVMDLYELTDVEKEIIRYQEI